MLVLSLVTDLSLYSLDLYSAFQIAAFYCASVCLFGVCKARVPVRRVHEHKHHPRLFVFNFPIVFTVCEWNLVNAESNTSMSHKCSTHVLTYQLQTTLKHQIYHSVQYRVLDTVTTHALLAHANTSPCNSIQRHSTTRIRRTVAVYCTCESNITQQKIEPSTVPK